MFAITRYTLRENLFEYPIVFQVVITLIVSILMLFSKNYNINNDEVLKIFGYIIASRSYGSLAQNIIIDASPFLAIMSVARPLSEIFDKKQAILIFSKTITRIEFVLQNIIGIWLTFFLFYLIIGTILSITIAIKFDIFPFHFWCNLLALPFFITAIYLISLITAIKFNNNGLTIFFPTVYMFISGLLYNGFHLYKIYNINIIQNFVIYCLPRLVDFQNMILQRNYNCLQIMKVGISILPITLYILFSINKKEF